MSSGMRALLVWIRTSPWMPVVLRAALGAGALIVLGGVGAAFGSPPKVVAPPLPALEDLPLVAAIHGAEARPRAAEDAGTPPSPPPPSPSPVTTSPPARGRAGPETPVHLNDADETELRRLPGVGAKRAEAILSLRRTVGRFRRLEDLLRVKGVGRGTLKKWRPLVRLEPRPSPEAADAGAPTS